MKKHILYIIFILNVTNLFSIEKSVQQIPQTFQEQKHAVSIMQASNLLKYSFDQIISKSYKELPCTRSIIKSNQTFSFDIQNKQFDFNTLIEYQIRYNGQYNLQISLVYAFEEVSYYQTYINFSSLAGVKNDIPIYQLQNEKLGSFLWNIDQSTAYYVYSFPKVNSRSNKSVVGNVVPGLLLKVQFLSKTRYNNDINKIITELVGKINWTNLQKIYQAS